jgi:hypothetical protein
MLWGQELSLYSPQALGERDHRCLLLQFLLFEHLEAYQAAKAGRSEEVLTAHPRFFPYDWAKPSGHLNKLYEHSLLLKKSFSEHSKLVKHYEKTLLKMLSSLPKKDGLDIAFKMLYTAMEPLIEVCKESENLLFFLLKKRAILDELNGSGYLHRFLLKIHSDGLETLGEKMCDQYHQRGFFSQIPEFKLLLTELLHA